MKAMFLLFALFVSSAAFAVQSGGAPSYPTNAYGETIDSTISSAVIQDVDCGKNTVSVTSNGEKKVYEIALHECLKIIQDNNFEAASKCGQLEGDVGLHQSGMFVWAKYKIVLLTRLHVVQRACI